MLLCVQGAACDGSACVHYGRTVWILLLSTQGKDSSASFNITSKNGLVPYTEDGGPDVFVRDDCRGVNFYI